MTTKRLQKVKWLTAGNGHFALCQRCGKSEPAPEYPLTIEAFVKYSDYLLEKHLYCVERTEEEVTETH